MTNHDTQYLVEEINRPMDLARLGLLGEVDRLRALAVELGERAMNSEQEADRIRNVAHALELENRSLRMVFRAASDLLGQLTPQVGSDTFLLARTLQQATQELESE